MKPLLVLFLLSTLETGSLTLAAQELPVDPVKMRVPPVALAPPASPVPPPPPLAPGFTRFSIDFPGGPPALLVEQITRQTGEPLNVIIPPEHTDDSLPPLKLSNVTVPQLFEALEPATRKAVTWSPPSGRTPFPSYQQFVTSMGFRTAGAPRPDSIWYFFTEGPPQSPPANPDGEIVCRFFQLGPYLVDHLKADDVTTAIETAWKMLQDQFGGGGAVGGGRAGKTATLGHGGGGAGGGGGSQGFLNNVRAEATPTMKFHEDTRLLIVVGPKGKVALIDDILRQLPGGIPSVDPLTGLPVPAGGLTLPVDPKTGLPVPAGGIRKPSTENAPFQPGKP